MRLLRALLSIFICLIGLTGTGSVLAHPLTTRNVRVIHLDAVGSDVVAYIRLTLPLLVGNGVAQPSADMPVPVAPFTLPRRESAQPFWYADIDAIRSNARELGRLVVEGHRVAVDGATIPGRLLSVGVHPRGHVPPFDTVAQAAIAVAPVPWPDDVTEIDSGYVIVDTAVAYSVPRNVRRLTVSSRLAPGALGEAATVNLVVDHRDRDAVYYRATGLLTEPLVVAPGPLEGAGTFVRGGIDHILSGMDHVLFVACLVMGATSVERASVTHHRLHARTLRHPGCRLLRICAAHSLVRARHRGRHSGLNLGGRPVFSFGPGRPLSDLGDNSHRTCARLWPVFFLT